MTTTSTIPTASTLSTASARASLKPAILSDRFESQQSFARVLGREDRSRITGTPESKARDAAQQFVAQVFVQPVLKQLRESNQAAAPFGPTDAEKTFRGQLDADLAQRIVRGTNWPLVDRLARDMLERSSPAPALTPGAGLDVSL